MCGGVIPPQVVSLSSIFLVLWWEFWVMIIISSSEDVDLEPNYCLVIPLNTFWRDQKWAVLFSFNWVWII
jgi:hypothetical protein